MNRTEFLQNQGNIYFIANDDLTDGDTDRIPDCYESTNEETPENSFILSNGSPSTSIIGNSDSDGDTMIDGDEVVFCTVGDVNHDGTINADDVTLLQGFLAGTAELSVIGKNSADCNLDGEVNDDDVAHLQNYLVDGLYDFDFSQTTLQFIASIMTNPMLGDVDGNGVREVADIVILQKYIHGVETFTAAAFNRSDLNGDHMVDVNDLGLLKRYILYSSPAPALTGYSYFYCISDPMKKDSDGDLDLDNADPNPMEYQLNGYFAEKMGELQEAAREYLGDSYAYDIEDEYSGRMDLWLCSYYIRQFNKDYTTRTWDVAGKDPAFVSYINENNPELCSYFASTKELYVSVSGQTLDCYHCYATLSALMMYKTFRLIRDLSGWAGDLQTVVNKAYDQTYKDEAYSDIGTALYNLMGNDSYDFGLKDLYGDIDAVNLEARIRSGSDDIESIICEYYSLDEIVRNQKFADNVGLTTQSIKTYVVGNDIPSFIKRNLSEEDVQLCVSAFKNYLQDTLEVEIP